MSGEKKCRTILVDGRSAKDFFVMPFPDMRMLLLKMGLITESERIRATWNNGEGDFVIDVVPWDKESKKRVARMKKYVPLLNGLKRSIPSLRNFSPQKRRGKNSAFKSSEM